MANEIEGKQYTNMRPSKVSVCNLDFLPGETKTIPARVKQKGPDGKGHVMVDNPHLAVLEAKDDDGNLTHPLRKGQTPILRPGIVAMPDASADPPSKPKDLSDLEAVKAMAMIRLTTDLGVLQGWTTDTRPEIQNALKLRIQTLNGAPAPK